MCVFEHITCRTLLINSHELRVDELAHHLCFVRVDVRQVMCELMT